eukprot:gnl/TRDRNA2_/TRDRNA2_161058_c3_seq1.p1 gnl/TRDRNA2_/TRDRNA2_161058_c3~~gnl/TRDRNA2_/TRDRNA2_161058_c3_seq1.p1  ORF type:complete len:238 (+),score=53.56 gnl/TRDRNA2_/TRDRNA2_161058_c3_seq1:84-716(+)
MLQHARGVLKAEGVPEDGDDMVVRRLFFDSMPEQVVEIEKIEQVMQPQLLKRFLRKVAEARASVEAVFHGTRAENAEKIVAEGLDSNICQTGAYGRGSYVGTHAGIAHQYANPDHAGRRQMCVLLVVVGSQVVRGQQGERHNVTAMDRMVNPTQYCFVDEDRLLVSHLIKYKVGSYERRRIGGGWEDPFERKLSNAVRRAAAREQKHGQR